MPCSERVHSFAHCAEKQIEDFEGERPWLIILLSLSFAVMAAMRMPDSASLARIVVPCMVESSTTMCSWPVSLSR